MEILNNIWSALSTENPGLVRIILIIAGFFEAYLFILLFSSLLKIQTTKRQNFLYILSSSLVAIFINNLFPPPYNSLFNFLILALIVFLIYKTTFIKTILAILLPTAILAIISSLTLKPILLLFNITFGEVEKIPIFRLIYLFLSYFIIILIVKFMQHRHSSLKLLPYFDDLNKKIILVNISVAIFTLCVETILTIYYINILPIYITFLNFISLLAYLFISFYSLTRVMKLHIKTKELENAENYNKTLSILYDNVKGFKHDFDNMLHMIGGFIQNDDMNSLKKYYLELESDYEKVKNIATLNPNLINNPGIYNLLVTKYKKANELGIKINLEYFFDFEKLHMPIYQFSRMLGILLDNAIEAAYSSSEKVVNIRFRDSTKNQTQIIIIENTYSNKDVDITKIFEKGVSEKNNHMGMGLWEVKQIVMNNNNINLIPTTDGKYFKQQLEIYY